MSTEPTLDEVTTRADVFFAKGSRARSAEPLGLPEPERYEMRETIGAGGMGFVMLAEDRALSRRVAVKILQVHDEEQRRQFARECSIAARLDHPNIVPLYDAGVDASGKPYLAMRYVEGENLRAVIRRLRENDPATRKRWSLEARTRVVLQLLSALSLAHARGVIHRDIKPDNVMIGPFGEVLLVDWGIACSPGETGPDKPVVGTPRYMSPEQVEGRALDARSDLFQAGVLAYELLTLQHPLGELPKDDEAQLAAVLSHMIVPAEYVRRRGHIAVPRSLSDVVMKALAHDPDQRWPSADAMMRAFELVLAGDAPVTCPHTAYAYGLSRIGRALDAFPRTIIGITFAVLALAAWGVVDIAGAVADIVR